jgi:hypothetical protein
MRFIKICKKPACKKPYVIIDHGVLRKAVKFAFKENHSTIKLDSFLYKP